MIRQDYLVRMIQRFLQLLTQVRQDVHSEDFATASEHLEAALKDLTGLNVASACTISTAELLARIVQGEPTEAVRTKCLVLTSLLNEAAEIQATQGNLEASQSCLVQAANLLLNVLLQEEDAILPDFVPKLAEILGRIEPGKLPPATMAAVMHYYERTGQFARAEDVLYELLDLNPQAAATLQWGISFYERLLGQSDSALRNGNLPRNEIEECLEEWRNRLRLPPAGSRS